MLASVETNHIWYSTCPEEAQNDMNHVSVFSKSTSAVRSILPASNHHLLCIAEPVGVENKLNFGYKCHHK